MDTPGNLFEMFAEAGAAVKRIPELQGVIDDLQKKLEAAERQIAQHQLHTDEANERLSARASRIAKLEADLAQATKSEADVRDKLDLVVSTLRHVVGSANDAVALVEPPAPPTSSSTESGGHGNVASSPSTGPVEHGGFPTEGSPESHRGQREVDPTTHGSSTGPSDTTSGDTTKQPEPHSPLAVGSESVSSAGTHMETSGSSEAGRNEEGASGNSHAPFASSTEGQSAPVGSNAEASQGPSPASPSANASQPKLGWADWISKGNPPNWSAYRDYVNGGA